MKMTFLGAAHEVTGSCTYIEAAGKRFIVDCGMEQGRNIFENAELPIPEADLDFAFLTHAHIDHSGYFPLICKKGFSGSIHATKATCSLCSIMLKDSAHIQESEAEWKNRKAKRAGRPPVEPIYTMENAEQAISQLEAHGYGTRAEIAPGIEARFTDAGHLLGSAAVEIWITEEGITKKLVFSGDLGNVNQPLLRDPQPVDAADYVMIESTYGDRLHNPPPDYAVELAHILQETFDKGGNLIIPSFAVGRTQELLYFFRHIKEHGMVRGHSGFPVYVDSPLAIEATSVFEKNSDCCFDEEASALIREGKNPIGCPDLKLSVTSQDSIAINSDSTPKVIISASGMCDAGRIRHHLKHNLWKPQNTVLFVGYQSAGTLGRSLVEGAKRVKLFGEDIEVRAQIRTLGGISGHADRDHLIGWLLAMDKKPTRVFINHGEDFVCRSFAELLSEKHGFDTAAPYSGSVFDLAVNAFEYEAQPRPIRRDETKKPKSGAYQRLLAALERLQGLVSGSSGRANKDIARLADRINELCDKW